MASRVVDHGESQQVDRRADSQDGISPYGIVELRSAQRQRSFHLVSLDLKGDLSLGSSRDGHDRARLLAWHMSLHYGAVIHEDGYSDSSLTGALQVKSI